MRRIGLNREAVSNVLGYLISFMIAASVMTSAVLITTNIIDNKTTSVAEVEAQSLANKVADALVEAMESKQSMPGAAYQKTLDVPRDLAGKSYYIETTSTRVYVNTTDGTVSKSSTTYSAEDLNIGISGRVYSGSNKLDVLSNKSDFVYKLDFGTGNSTDQSPVESGYYMVSNRSTITQALRDPPWWNLNYHYRIPIKVKNNASEDLDEVPIKIVLDTTNFDYSNANVSVTSSSTVSSDLVFVDSGYYGVVAEVEISPDTWYTWWLGDYLVGDIQIEVTITELSEGYDLDNIDGDSIKLNGVSCKSWNGDEHKATFDPQEALLSLGDDPTPGEYTITISGSLNDWTPFYGWDDVTVALADILVDDDANPLWYDATHVRTVQEGIDNASSGDSVFVYNGEYNEHTITIDKEICLIGESRDDVIISLTGAIGDVVDVTADNVYIDSVTIRDGFKYEASYYGNGIRLDNCKGVSIINCNISNNEENGILVWNSWDNKIINCNVYDNGYGPDGVGPPAGVPDAGIYLYGGSSKRNIVKDCNIFDNDEIGIWLYVAWDNNIVENCTVYNNVGSTEQEYGIKLEDANCHNNIVRDCNVYSHTSHGIYLYDKCYLNTILNCTSRDNQGDGIRIEDQGSVNGRNIIKNCTSYNNGIDGISIRDNQLAVGNGNVITDCKSYGNNYDGIFLYDAHYNQIKNSESYNNNNVDGDGAGIHIEDSDNNDVINCDFYNDAGEIQKYGIYLETSESNDVTDCNIYNNYNDGVHLTGSKYNQITGCNVFDNGDDGAHLAPSAGVVYSKHNTIEYCNIYCNGDNDATEEAGLYIQQYNTDNSIIYNNFGENENYPAYDECNAAFANDYAHNFWLGEEYTEIYSGYYVYYIPGGGQMDGYPEWDFLPNPDVIIVKLIGGVSQSPPPHYHLDSIQAGINNVQPEGTVIVKPAVDGWTGDPIRYNEKNIFINKTLNLIGVPESGMEVIVNPGEGGTEDIFIVNADDVSISGLTVKNGTSGIRINGPADHASVTDCKLQENDYGIYVYESYDYNDITNCTVHNNTYGIYIDDHSEYVVIENCDIHNNNGRGICIDNSDNNVIENCNIHDNTGRGIFIYTYSDGNSIKNCDISNNSLYGVQIHDNSDNNVIENCDIYEHDNVNNNGIYISGTSIGNNVKNCDVSNNYRGIKISSSDSNTIIDSNIGSNNDAGIVMITDSGSNTVTNCNIYSNDDGINITGFSTYPSSQNDIMNCNIYSNTQYGICISGFSNSNRIINRNNIRDNDYGIYISDSDSSNNEIHHNNFENNNYNAYDAGSNTWNKSYGTPFDPLTDGGNHWDNYDEGYEGAYDFYSGPGQDILGSDGVVDTPYNIPGGSSQDGYPFGGEKMEVRPYYIDYWNPYGQSIILVNMSLKSHTFKYIYLYYGYDEPLDDFHNHSIEEVSLFSDDFNDPSLVNQQWNQYPSGGSIQVSNGYIKLTNSAHIVTKPSVFSIPENEDPQPIVYSKTTNESMYIVEAMTKINNGQGNMFFLTNPLSSAYDQCYLVSADVNPVSNFTLHKNRFGVPEELLDFDSSVPDLDHWLRMKSYIYLSKTCYKTESTTNREMVAFITGYLYNYDTFADEGNISGRDTNISRPSDPTGDPWMKGEIGLGARLLSSCSQNSDILVDWVRVMKTPIVPPTVSIGSIESSTSNYGWTSSPGSENRESFDPFNPGPVLCDFNYGTTPATFVVYLPADTYTITVTMGDKNASHGPMNIELESAILLTIPETEPGEFETKWFTRDWEGGDLYLKFSSTGTDWVVNSMLIERGCKGIKIE